MRRKEREEALALAMTVSESPRETAQAPSW
jgi:hypothetical protein